MTSSQEAAGRTADGETQSSKNEIGKLNKEP
jgi:hypothetical protein